jgi:hypothetical protein
MRDHPDARVKVSKYWFIQIIEKVLVDTDSWTVVMEVEIR